MSCLPVPLLRPLLLSCALLAMAPAASWSAPAAANLKLRDTRWALETLAGAPVSEAGAKVQLVLASSSQHLSGHAGCNRLRGRYTQRGTQLALKPLTTTRMACAPAQMALEDRFLQTLGRIDSYRVEGKELSLMQGDAVQATFRALEKR
jgi:heat shock protein HslJ